MPRSLGALFILAAALLLAPAAEAWTRIADLAYGVELVGLRTRAGTELLAWNGGPAGLIPRQLVLLRVGASPRALLSLADEEEFTAKPVLLQQPRGKLLLYDSTTRGVVRLESTDDGRTWSGPFATELGATERVLGGAVRPNGTPLLAAWLWDGDSAVEPVLETVQGLAGGQRHVISIDAVGAIAVTRRNEAYLVYGFNPGEFVAGQPATYLQRLDGAGAPASARRRIPDRAGPPTAGRTGELLIPAKRGVVLQVLTVRGGHQTVRTVARGFWLSWASPIMFDVKGRPSALWGDDNEFLAVRSRGHDLRFRNRTSLRQPPLFPAVTANGPQTTMTLLSDKGIDLFINYDDRILRERFTLSRR